MRSNGTGGSAVEENVDDFLGCLNIPINVSCAIIWEILKRGYHWLYSDQCAQRHMLIYFHSGDPSGWM